MRRAFTLSRSPWIMVALGSVITTGALTATVHAQVPSPRQHRTVHPAIADPAPSLQGLPSAPLFNPGDGIWNHGEGFVTSVNRADTGAWRGVDDGLGLTAAEIFPSTTINPAHYWAPAAHWTPFTWVPRDDGVVYPPGPHAMRRFEGWLRPTTLQLPQTHPLYGSVGPHVDQGAFELFIPTVPRSSTQKIVICMLIKSTRPFPQDKDNVRRAWYQIYPGIFSPDGLERREPRNQPRSPASFMGNTDDGEPVVRPPLNLMAQWNNQQNPTYWPILAYPVLSVMHRQTTLNEQRYLQVQQAVRLLLQENSTRNPLGPGNHLTPQQVEQQVVTFWVGGSNGGLQSQVAALRFPNLVHGIFSEVINPSLQRFYNELDQGHALARLTGAGMLGAGTTASDYLHWGQYAWAQGLEIHDISYSRLFAAGRTYRPAAFTVGDEDITSTGTDWVRTIPTNGAPWTDSGRQPNLSGRGNPNQSELAWMVAEAACHENSPAPVRDPYTGTNPVFLTNDLAHQTITQAVAQHTSLGTPPPAPFPLTHQPRTPDQQLRGLDDPQEWFLGRRGQPLPAVAPLGATTYQRDDAFFLAVQPSSAGTEPGRRESMLIRDGKLFVGSADGVVSRFSVDPAFGMKQRLWCEDQSDLLAQEAFALAATNESPWRLIVGTRRHLFKLDPADLRATPVVRQLPWEVAQPHHMVVADVLPFHPGQEIVFAALHGGLVFCDLNLVPLHEWPEPGIVDFRVSGNVVTILSSRGVVANVTFSLNTGQVPNKLVATLQAVSKPIPDFLDDYTKAAQGEPMDLEFMRFNTGQGISHDVIALWRGDIDGFAVRRYRMATLAQDLTYLTTRDFPGGSWIDVATCAETADTSGSKEVGDHALVLTSDSRLLLFGPFRQKLGEKSLKSTTQPGIYPFGAGAHTLAVGELVTNSGVYTQEVVVATDTGLMWLHVNDLLGTQTQLPSTYWVETTKALGPTATTHIQPRTNQTMASTWAIARRTDLSTTPPTNTDNFLHVLDQRGAYWRVDHSGRVRLFEASTVLGARGWGFVGPVSSGFPPGSPHLGFNPLGLNPLFGTNPWCPRITGSVVMEKAPGNFYITNNWTRRTVPKDVVEGFLVNSLGGGIVAAGSSGRREAWFWSAHPGDIDAGTEEWGNLLEAVRLDANGSIIGIWDSSGWPASFQGNLGDRCPFHNLRSIAYGTPIMNQQSVVPVQLSTGEVVAVLGCPGGRVRIVRNTTMRSNAPTSPPHDVGIVDSSPTDLGYGGSAIAVRREANDVLRIWLGTVSDPAARPSGYAAHPATEALQDSEVATGGLTMLTWTPGLGGPSSGFSVQPTIALHPTAPTGARPRGAYGVVGMLLTDLVATIPGDELIVGTLSGDLIAFNISPAPGNQMTEIWRTHVHGNIGHYNSILAEDLNNDGRKEIYVAGSMGLWRFKQPNDVSPQVP